MEQGICKICGISKDLAKDNFWQGNNKRNGQDNFYWHKSCKVCERPKILNNIQKYKNKNRKSLAEKQKEYHSNNKENDSETKKIWYQKNKSKVVDRIKVNVYKRRKTDSGFRLRESVSTQIRLAIKKDSESFLKFIDYSLEELKKHIELQFEEWMTWENYGTYRINIWDDNDKTTWTWQLDHIIPHSKFEYNSMEDKLFKECWALENLRPLSSKQNLLDGNRR